MRRPGTVSTGIWVLVLCGLMQAATVTIDASKPTGPLKRFERYNTIQSWISGATEIQLLKDLGTTHIRGIKSENSIAMVDATSIFNKWGYPSSLTDYENELYSELKHYKERFPLMEHVEIMNEPDGTWYHGGYKSPSQYMSVFKAGIRAVNRMNAEIPANLPKLKIGGPVTYKWNPTYLYDCLEIVKNEKIKFDFIVWHDYHVKDKPAAIRDRTREMRAKLKSMGLDHVEIIITEWGIEPGGDKSDPPSWEVLRSAAFVASGNYYWMDGGADIVCQWVVRHKSNRVKSQFVGSAGSGKVYPFYNVLKMMSMQKDTRVRETIDGMTSQGIGVGGYGAYDETGISAIIWNYEGSEEQTSVVFPNLPQAFRTGAFKVERYLIDDTHSNYKHDSNRDRLEKLDEKTAAAAPTYTSTVTMKKNSIAMIILTPSGTVDVGNYQPTAEFSVIGAGSPAPCATQFDGSASSDLDGSIVAYAWDFGDGSTGTGATASHTYTANNTYTVKLTVTDDSGATAQATQAVFVGEKPPTAALVVGNTSLNGGDAAVKSRLESMGYTVEILDDDAVSASGVAAADVVLISSTSASGSVAGKLKDAAVPMVIWETWLYDDMGMTGPGSDTDYGTAEAANAVSIVNSNHDLAAGLSQGEVTVGTAIGWGRPGSSATVVATVDGDAAKAAVFAYDQGASMVSGTAPARRVGFLLSDNTATGLTDDGWKLLEAAVRWATGNAATLVPPMAASATLAGGPRLKVRQVAGGLAIGFDGPLPGSVTVHTALGRTVATPEHLRAAGATISLPRGIYMIRVKGGTTASTIPAIVK